MPVLNKFSDRQFCQTTQQRHDATWHHQSKKTKNIVAWKYTNVRHLCRKLKIILVHYYGAIWRCQDVLRSILRLSVVLVSV